MVGVDESWYRHDNGDNKEEKGLSPGHGLPRNIDAGVSRDRCNLANVSPDCQAFLLAGGGDSASDPGAPR